MCVVHINVLTGIDEDPLSSLHRSQTSHLLSHFKAFGSNPSSITAYCCASCFTDSLSTQNLPDGQGNQEGGHLSPNILHVTADSSAAPLANYFKSNYFWQFSVTVVSAPKTMPIVEDADFDANLFGFG
jgi:hypothetical protein